MLFQNTYEQYVQKKSVILLENLLVNLIFCYVHIFTVPSRCFTEGMAFEASAGPSVNWHCNITVVVCGKHAIFLPFASNRCGN